jgi:hypothetical protein
MRRQQHNPKPISKLAQDKHLLCRVDVDAVAVAAKCGNDKVTYDIDTMIEMRDRLNEEKTKQDKYYMSDICPNYMKIQNNVDLYKTMRFTLMDRFGAQLVTNAWIKYYEIYLHYKLIPESGEFKAFCNAELPGASICALNHVVKTLRPGLKFDWRASSLVLGESHADQVSALGDHYGVWRRNQDKWLMTVAPAATNDARVKVDGADDLVAPGEVGYINNGDATDYNNILDYEARIGPGSEFGGVHIYSHDAGIDVSAIDTETGESGYNMQEILDAKIHLGCAIAGFATLRKGGNFVAKQYTYFETLTHNLIFIYAALFDKFYLCKPLTSKPYNSEIYLVGIGFRGFDKKIRKVLVDRLNNFNTTPLFARADLPPLSEIERFSTIVFGQQIRFIRENIEFYEKYGVKLGGFLHALDGIKQEKQAAWLRTYPMKPIHAEDRIPSDKVRDFRS